MEKKLKIVLMSALLISLVVVTYFIIFNSFIEMFDLNLRDTLAILSNIFNLLGIIIAASVAIYVMDKNHRDTDAREDKRKKDNDNIEIRKAQFRILDAVRTCHVSYADIRFSYNEDEILDFKYIENIKDIVNDMNDSLKLNKELAIYDINVYITLTETTNKMLDDIADIQQLLDSKTVRKKAGIIELLKRINNKGYEYLKNNSVFDFNQDLKV